MGKSYCLLILLEASIAFISIIYWIICHKPHLVAKLLYKLVRCNIVLSFYCKMILNRLYYISFGESCFCEDAAVGVCRKLQCVLLFKQMQYFFGILVFLFGAALGSFVAVIAGRHNTGLSFLKGRSICFSCGAKLEKKDLVPIFSFLFLGQFDFN